MEIKEKNNITAYLLDYTERFFILSYYSPLDYEFQNDDYRYILPKNKACFSEFHQLIPIVVYVEKIDEQKKRVYLSQVHWLLMKNLIKAELGLDVKILKRYPKKLTVAELKTPDQKIDKVALKKLSESVSEKIHIKPADYLAQSR